jgi:UDP-2-acetamido-2,6-beta-L-arabino-hexul-4-ose reductase
MRDVRVTTLDVKRDERGWLAEVIRKEELSRRSEFGQFLVTTAGPGFVKGNHYHTRKYEWYCVLKGEGLLLLVDRRSGEREELRLSEHQLTTVRIPPQVTHAIENVGTEMMYLLVYTDESFNEEDPDTFYEKIR